MTANKTPHNLRKPAAILAAVALFAFFVLGACASRKTDDLFRPQELVTTIEDGHALKTYEYDDLDDVLPTLRADVMQVTERNVARPQVKVMSDTFTLSSGDDQTAITFTEYPSPGHNINANTASFAQDAAAYGAKHGIADAEQAKKTYFSFYKYMLLTQHNRMLRDCESRSREGTLTQDLLYKHPGADAQYGAVEGENNAVVKVITLDPVYRSYHPTGLYVPAGEAVTITVEGMEKGERMTAFLGLQDTMGWRGDASTGKAAEVITGMGKTVTKDYFTDADTIAAADKFHETCDANGATSLLSSQYNRQNNRAPMMASEFRLDENKTYTIGSPIGGILHINMVNCYSSAKLTIRGAVETPHYILGVTTPEYFDEYLRNAPGVYGVIETENGQLIGPSVCLRDTPTDEIDKLAMLWHSFFSINETFTGGTYNRNNLVKFDHHVPAGAAVALGGYVYACPETWYEHVTNFRSLLSGGAWGTLHEIGHNHGSAFGTVWGLGGGMEGEVRNNALIVLCYLKFCDIGTTVSNGKGAEHGECAHAYTELRSYMNAHNGRTDYSQFGYFDSLSNYVNIMHSFGVDKFFELLNTYKTTPTFTTSAPTDKNMHRRADWIYRCAKVFGMDFRNYYNTYYCTNVLDEYYDAEQLAFMQSLPVYHPLANQYAGGIDGVHTGGDHLVSYGDPIELDLQGKMLTTAAGFTIQSVTSPTYGTLTALGDGKYSYAFNPNYRGAKDNFDMYVKLDNGQVHVLHISLRIDYSNLYHTATMESWDSNIPATLDESLAFVKTTPAEATETITNVTNHSYTSQGRALRRYTFQYKAPSTGDITLHIKNDDMAVAFFGENFSSLKEVARTSRWDEIQSFTVSVQKGKLYAMQILGYNTAGKGGLVLGNAAQINSNMIYPADFTPEQAAAAAPYVYEPKFMLSKKDNVVVGSLSSPKSDWKVLQAPENIHQGRFYEETMLVDPEKGETAILKKDKWDWLIDDDPNTMLHTAYTGNTVKPITPENPDVFVIDTNKIQQFNYFSVTTRNTANAQITTYKLEVSADNVHYTTVAENSDPASPLAYKVISGRRVARWDFDAVTGRYWRLTVTGTSGHSGKNSFTIISELSTGAGTSTQQIVPSTTKLVYSSKGFINSAKMEDAPAGHMVARKKNSKLVLRFRGTSVALYGTAAPGYGKADVKIDGKKVGEIDLNAPTRQTKKLIFLQEQLKDKEHTVEVITKSAALFNVNFVGLSYGADLINAPNIYLERGLAISLTVFILLFALVTAFVVLLYCLPKFRDFVLRPARKTAEAGTEKPKKTEKAQAVQKPAAAEPTKKSVAAEPTRKPAAEAEKKSATTASPAKKTPSREELAERAAAARARIEANKKQTQTPSARPTQSRPATTSRTAPKPGDKPKK